MMDVILREAAKTDDTTTLYALIKENVQILEGFDEKPFVETPLHIAAAEGNIKFAMQMVTLKPSFAKKLDANLNSPLHLAVKKGQTQMALWLLKYDKNLLRVKGIDCNTPLHIAVNEGNVELLDKFLESCPESAKDLTSEGFNALHLAIESKQFEATQMLVNWFDWQFDGPRYRDEVFNGKDVSGNTPLHIAAKKNATQVVKLLAKHERVKKNIKNLEGKTALDILEDESPPLNNIEAKKILRGAGGSIGASREQVSLYCFDDKKKPSKKMSFVRKVWMDILRGRKRLTDDQSNAMLVVAALIITISFQGVLSPPGGVYQKGDEDDNTTTIAFSPNCNITCNNNTTSPTCTIRCNNDKDHDRISKTAADRQIRRGMSVMPKETFGWYCFLNTLSLLAACCMTIFLLPPGTMVSLFNGMLFCLLSGYWISVSIISPHPRAGTWASVAVSGIYVVCSFYSLVTRRLLPRTSNNEGFG